jgi:hypothetical protein
MHAQVFSNGTKRDVGKERSKAARASLQQQRIDRDWEGGVDVAAFLVSFQRLGKVTKQGQMACAAMPVLCWESL